MLLTILFSYVRFPSIFRISASIYFFLPSFPMVLSLITPVLSATIAVSYLISSSRDFCYLISAVRIEDYFLIFSMINSVSLIISSCCPLKTYCFLYYLFTFWVYFRILLIFSAYPFISLDFSSIDFSSFITSILSWERSDSLLFIIFRIDYIAVLISSVAWNDYSR